MSCVIALFGRRKEIGLSLLDLSKLALSKLALSKLIRSAYDRVEPALPNWTQLPSLSSSSSKTGWIHDFLLNGDPGGSGARMRWSKEQLSASFKSMRGRPSKSSAPNTGVCGTDAIEFKLAIGTTIGGATSVESPSMSWSRSSSFRTLSPSSADEIEVWGDVWKVLEANGSAALELRPTVDVLGFSRLVSATEGVESVDPVENAETPLPELSGGLDFLNKDTNERRFFLLLVGDELAAALSIEDEDRDLLGFKRLGFFALVCEGTKMIESVDTKSAFALLSELKSVFTGCVSSPGSPTTRIVAGATRWTCGEERTESCGSGNRISGTSAACSTGFAKLTGLIEGAGDCSG